MMSLRDKQCIVHCEALCALTLKGLFYFYLLCGPDWEKIHITIDMSMVMSGLSQKFAVPSMIMPCAKFLAHIKENFQDKMTVMNNSSHNNYMLSQQISAGNWPDGENDTLCLICPAE